MHHGMKVTELIRTVVSEARIKIHIDMSDHRSVIFTDNSDRLDRPHHLGEPSIQIMHRRQYNGSTKIRRFRLPGKITTEKLLEIGNGMVVTALLAYP